MHGSSTPGKRGAPLAFFLAALTSFAVAGCGGRGQEAARAASVSTSRRAATASAACIGTDAHDTHVQERGLGCAVCHPAGGVYGFADYSYPGGTTTAGGAIVRGGDVGPTTCSVGCHSPFGGLPHVVAWTEPGPLDCTACHDTTAMPLAHPPVSASFTRADCEVCHLTSGHTSGTVASSGTRPAGWISRARASTRSRPSEASRPARAATPRISSGGFAQSLLRLLPRPHRRRPRARVSWKVDCLMCHGRPDEPVECPPVPIWGYRDDPVRIGAHASHVNADRHLAGVCVQPVPRAADRRLLARPHRRGHGPERHAARHGDLRRPRDARRAGRAGLEQGRARRAATPTAMA